jgi:DNA-nicking Smr family endonuclease
MTRRLSTDERALWDTLRRAIRPLRSTLQQESADTALLHEPREPAAQAGELGAAAPDTVKQRVPSQPRMSPLDKRLRRRLSHGALRLNGRIDLHGMQQDRAFAVLVAFLRESQSRGARIVLVITGKGRSPDGEGQGVLRRMVPGWLARADLRDVVAGFEEASRRHGGEGALYVRLRRIRRGLADAAAED